MEDTSTPYATNADHLLDLLGYLDLLLRRAIVVERARRPSSEPEHFRGMLITEAGLDSLMESSRTGASGSDLSGLDDAILARRESIHARCEATTVVGGKLALAALAEARGLSDAETDILLVALGPELETRYETIYAYLQNDLTRKRPSVDLALELICRDVAEKIFARRLLSPDARLVAFGLIELVEESYDKQPTELRRFLKVDPSVVRFLLDEPPVAREGVRVVLPAHTTPELSVSEQTGRGLEALARALARAGLDGGIVLLEGAANAPLEQAAVALGHALGRALLIVDADAVSQTPALARAAALDAALWGAAPVLRLPEPVEEDPNLRRLHGAIDSFWGALRHFGVGAIALGCGSDLRLMPVDFRVWRLSITGPELGARRALWEAATSGHAVDAVRLADTFPFGADRIRQAVALAQTTAAIRDPTMPEPTPEEFLDAARALATPNLHRFAVVVAPKHGWDDLVLSPDRKQQLRSVEARVLNRGVVQEDWGFGDKLTRGKGVAVLFSGPPGTGKTMAAEILAANLSLDLFQIDLSTVMSKYIGETERQLAAIFREAEQGQCILFFDECDSIFGKRTEVHNAHDHYANTQVNYLLQRLEQYEGIVLLATNLQKNIDEAFLRRLQDSIDFPFPDGSAREQIWRRQFPAKAPLAQSIDFAYLAGQFRLAGGNIRNAAEYAAYRAAETGGRQGVITMEHILEGVKREFQKLGKLVVAADQPPGMRGVRL